MLPAMFCFQNQKDNWMKMERR